AVDGEGEFFLVPPSLHMEIYTNFFGGCNFYVGSASFNLGRLPGLWVVDASRPKIAQISLAGTSPTSASQVSYVVRPAEFVSSLDAADFSIVASGPTGTSLGAVTDL